MARQTHVVKTSPESKAEIVENSVLGSNVPINPVGDATEMKKRFVNPIVNGDGKASAISELDRVVDETEAALDEIDKNANRDISVLFQQDETIIAQLEKTIEDVQDLDENKVNKLGDTMNGPLTVESKTGPGKVEVSEQGVFVTDNGENGTAYDDGAIVNQGKKIVIPLKDGTMALAEETVAKVIISVDESNYKVYVKAFDINGKQLDSSSSFIDLPLESMVVGGAYNDITHRIELTLQNGNIVSFPVDELVNGLISSSEKGQPNGVASLDAEGKVPKDQISDAIIVSDLYMSVDDSSLVLAIFAEDGTQLASGSVTLPSGSGGGGSLDPSVLVDYVKFTDYATASKAGVVKAIGGAGSGIRVESGIITIYPANKGEIDNTFYYPAITSLNIGYATKHALVHPEKYTRVSPDWTDEEKAKACETIGAVPKPSDSWSTAYGGGTIAVLVNGEWKKMAISGGYSAYNIAMRQENGVLNVGTPTADSHATPRSYVDGLQKFTHYITIGTTDENNLINVSLKITNNSNTSFAIKEDREWYNFSLLASEINDTANGAVSASGTIQSAGELTHLVLRAISSDGSSLQLETCNLADQSLEYIEISGEPYMLIDKVI